jgi:hypothetical protein
MPAGSLSVAALQGLNQHRLSRPRGIGWQPASRRAIEAGLSILSSTAMPGGLRLVWEVMGSMAHSRSPDTLCSGRRWLYTPHRSRSQFQAKVDTRFAFEPAQVLPN